MVSLAVHVGMPHPEGRAAERDAAASAASKVRGRDTKRDARSVPKQLRLADLALAISCYPAVHVLMRSALGRLRACVRNRTLPRDDAPLGSTLSLLLLAERAHVLLGNPGTSPDETEWRSAIHEQLTRSMPLIAAMLADDGVAATDATRARALGPAAAAAPPPPSERLGRWARKHCATRRLVLMYLLNRVRAADDTRAEQLCAWWSRAGLNPAELRGHPDVIEALVDILIGSQVKLETYTLRREVSEGGKAVAARARPLSRRSCSPSA